MGGIPPKNRESSQAEAAGHLCLSTRQLRDLMGRGILPRGADLDDLRKAYIEHLRETAAGRTVAPDKLDPGQERAKRDREVRLGLKQRRLRDARALLPAGEVEAAWAGRVAIAKSRLLALPTRLAPVLVTCSTMREMEDAARDAVFECLLELSGDREETPDEQRPPD